MASNRVRVPRASLAVTAIGDSDYICMMQQGTSGIVAWGVFCALLCEAKSRGNDGVFTEPLAVISAKIHMPVKDIRNAVKTIAAACAETGNQPWILLSENGRLTIRSHRKWNNWGGDRTDSKMGASGEQDAQLDPNLNGASGEQDGGKACHTVPVPVPVPVPVRSVPDVSSNPVDPRGANGRVRAGKRGTERTEHPGPETVALALADPVGALVLCGVDRAAAESLAACCTPARIGNGIQTFVEGKWPDDPTAAFRSLFMRTSRDSELTAIGKPTAAIAKAQQQHRSRKEIRQ